MNLIFDALQVSCSQAMDGELRRVTFDASLSDDDELNRKIPYFSIGRNFEFPGGPTIEWHDGERYSGGEEITSMKLGRKMIKLRTSRPDTFSITFTLPDYEFSELREYLEDIMRGTSCYETD